MASENVDRIEPAGHAARLDHVGITVADLKAMTEWYAQSLRLEVEFEFTVAAVELSGVMLRSAGGDRIELLHRPGNRQGLAAANPAEAALTRGYSHVALDVADVDEAYAQLLEAGATECMSPRSSPEPGVRMAYLADPEGNLIELLDRTSAATAG